MFPLTNHRVIVMAMKQVIQIRCKNNKKIVNVNIGSTLSDVYKENNLNMPYGPVCAKVNNKVEGLHYRLYHKKDVEFLDMTNREKQSSGEQILQNALQFINTPYKYGGTNASGIDCSGLVSAALNIQRWTTSSGDIPTTKKITIYGTKSTFVNELLIGDILVWRWNYYDKNLRRYVDKGHCCIYAGNGRIFHTHGAAGTPTGYTSDLLTYWVNKHGIPNVYRR